MFLKFFFRINTQLEVLTSSIIAWRQLECGLSQFQLALGQDLSVSGIKNMSSDARTKLAKELAFFFNYMHQKTASQKPAQYNFYSRLDTKDKSASQKVCEFFTKHIPGQSDLLNDLLLV